RPPASRAWAIRFAAAWLAWLLRRWLWRHGSLPCSVARRSGQAVAARFPSRFAPFFAFVLLGLSFWKLFFPNPLFRLASSLTVPIYPAALRQCRWHAGHRA